MDLKSWCLIGDSIVGTLDVGVGWRGHAGADSKLKLLLSYHIIQSSLLILYILILTVFLFF